MFDQYKISPKNEVGFFDFRIETLLKSKVVLNKNFAVVFILLSSSSKQLCVPKNCFDEDDFLIQFEDSQAFGILQKINSVSIAKKIEGVIEKNKGCGCNIGVAISPMHGKSIKDLTYNAFQAAMASTKNSDGGWGYYNENKLQADKARKKNNTTNQTLYAGLENALKNDNFFLEYQGQVHSKTGALIAVEALIRWCPQNGTVIPPNEFIPFAEKNGLIFEITDWVLNKACQQGVAWKDQGRPVRIAVNVSPDCLLHENFINTIDRALELSDLPAELLEIEITETNRIIDLDRTNKILQHLKSLGIIITLDDFGKDHSFLKHLSFLCVDKIKIDRQFIQSITSCDRVLKIVQSIIEMSRKMGVQCLAEGVETIEQAAMLEKVGCCLMQGFLWHKPGREIPDWKPEAVLKL
jgi:EAL domain-containing protein (putative c-di-GMP-specific phosphodiesterase class I)